MKKAFLISLAVYFLGFILKFFHAPFHAIIMLGGIFFMLAASIRTFIKKPDELNGMLGIATALWLTFLLFTVKYFPYSNIVLLLAAMVSTYAMISTIKVNLMDQKLMLGFAVVLALAFYFTPTDTRYYYMSIKWNHEVETDFRSWDKYSWFLYINHKYDDALKASQKANQILENSSDDDWKKFIASHTQQIKDKSWKHYQ